MNLRTRPIHPDRRIGGIRLQTAKPGERKYRVAVSLLMIILAPTVSGAAELRPETLTAWNHYIEQAKARMNSRLDARQHFLWLDEEPNRARQVRSGEIVVRPVNGGRTQVSNGLIHDWIGAAFFADTTIAKIFATMDDYARYKDFYKPTVI